MAVIGTLFLHTTAGWYGLQFQLAAMAFLVINTLYMSAGFLVLQFFRDKVWLKNQPIYLVENPYNFGKKSETTMKAEDDHSAKSVIQGVLGFVQALKKERTRCNI